MEKIRYEFFCFILCYLLLHLIYNDDVEHKQALSIGGLNISIILIILIVVIIELLIKIYDYKKTNSELSKQNKELTNKIELLVGPFQQTSEQNNKDTQYASHPPMTFSEEDV